MTNKHFHFIVPVWGATYTQLFTDTCLPMLITAGNFDHSLSANDKLILVTTQQDSYAIKRSDSFNQLAKLLSIKFILIDGIIALDNAYRAMSACYALAINQPNIIPEHTYFVFLTPDSFWPKGTFKYLRELANAGSLIVMATGFRTNAESMRDEVSKLLSSDKEKHHFSNECLLKLVIKHLHPMTQAHNWLSPSGFLNAWPSHIDWVSENQIISHCFHLHPILVRAPTENTEIGKTIDDEFVKNLNYPIDKFHIIQNEYYAIELTDSNRCHNESLEQPSLTKISKFTLKHVNLMHWHFFRHKISLGTPNHNSIDIDKMAAETAYKLLRIQNTPAYMAYIRLSCLFDSIKRKLMKMIAMLFKTKEKKTI